MKVYEHLRELQEETEELARLHSNRDEDREAFVNGYGTAVSLAVAAEQLFIYSKPLASLPEGDELICDLDVHAHWTRYANSNTRALDHHVEQLLDAAVRFFAAGHNFFEQSGRFVAEEARRLPPGLRSFFETAWHLFSVEQYESGVFSALRGLEGVLREVLRRQKIMLRVGNREHPLHEQALHDLIQAASELRWVRGGAAVLTKQAAAQLHFLRHARNAAAHPDPDGSAEEEWRETSTLGARAAVRLWRGSQEGRRKCNPKVVQKTW